jgi:hypothetical protein
MSNLFSHIIDAHRYLSWGKTLVVVLMSLTPITAMEVSEKPAWTTRYAWTMVGKTEVEARDHARRSGFTVMARDEVSTPGTVHVVVDRGVVVYAQASPGGIFHQGLEEGTLITAWQSWLGMPEEAVRKEARRQGIPCRTVRRDDASFPVTMDFSPERINLIIRGGLVVTITSG